MKKPKTKKKKTDRNAEKKAVRHPVEHTLPADYRESVIGAAKLTAGIAGAALLVPLKLSVSEKRISLSSFTYSIRYEKIGKSGFRAGLFPSDMTVKDAQKLALAICSFYRAQKSSHKVK